MRERFVPLSIGKFQKLINEINEWWRVYSTFASHEVTSGVKGIYWTGRANFLEQREYYEFAIGAQYALGDAEALVGGGLLVIASKSRSRTLKTLGLLAGLGLGYIGVKHVRDASKADDMLRQELTKPNLAWALGEF